MSWQSCPAQSAVNRRNVAAHASPRRHADQPGEQRTAPRPDDHRYHAAFDRDGGRTGGSGAGRCPDRQPQLFSRRQAILVHEHTRYAHRFVHRRRGNCAGTSRRGRSQRDWRTSANGSTTAPACCAASCRRAVGRRPRHRRRPPARTFRRTTASRARFGRIRTCSPAPTTKSCSSTTTRASSAYVDAASGKRTPVGKPGMIRREVLHRTAHISWSASEASVLAAAHLERVSTGRRNLEPERRKDPHGCRCADGGRRADQRRHDRPARRIDGHPLEPATLVWVEALDKGDIRNKVPHRDRIVTLKAPFTGEPTEVAKTEYRFGGAELDRQRHHPADRDRPRDAYRPGHGCSTQLERAAQALGPQAAGRLRAPGHADASAREEHDPADRRRRSTSAARARRSRAIGRSSIDSI